MGFELLICKLKIHSFAKLIFRQFFCWNFRKGKFWREKKIILQELGQLL
jgi:hypothetical protein